ncbi:hypothetical protein [Pseudaquabacterium pictum]|uniref:Uncharacterized protein n=1 Tax=Pseudaquabacterium pictum TaxID=2315236 RepID=A0A480AKW7_9BURK|nr:hypothetical protein [Rubrivivax pictus]GCL61027.1 hypothetical protein AQPW35_01080 [Rubrivivax pictus]
MSRPADILRPAELRTRLAHGASCELSELLCYLARSLRVDAQRDEALPVWRSIVERANTLNDAVLGVLGGDDPAVQELAEVVHGDAAHWPAWLTAPNGAEQGATHG